MASVIARGTLISPGFSRPSVIWCTLRLHGRGTGNGGVGLEWAKWPYHNARRHARNTHGCSHRHAHVCLDVHKDPHPCLSFLTLEASSRRRSQGKPCSHACTHACMHVCMQCFFFTLILCLYLCFSEALSCPCTISLENISINNCYKRHRSN